MSPLESQAGAVALAALVLGIVSAVPVPAETDPGYVSLFTTNNESMSGFVSEPGPVPLELVGGSYIIPSLGQFEMGDQKVQGLFDAFGKLHRFGFNTNGSMTFVCKMMDTAFYNQSEALGAVGPGNVFYKTDPPRKFTGMQNIGGPNDNVFVNTYRIGEGNNTRMRSITDSQTGVEFDPHTLKMMRNITWNDRLDKPAPPITYESGSAHPQWDKESGCLFNVHPMDIMFTGWFPKVSLYKICPDDPNKRIVLNSYRPSHIPYFHSWGLSENFVITTHQPFTINVDAMIMGGTIVDSFKPLDALKDSAEIVLMPIAGGKHTTFKAPSGIYYSHTVNTFEINDTVVTDIVNFESNPFIQASYAPFYRNETQRNSMPAGLRGVVTRVTMHVSGDKKGQVDMKPLSVAGRATDFTTINDEFARKPYCIYYADEWFHEEGDYAAMAIVKHDICKGERTYFYKKGCYPSEPRFIDSAKSHLEEDGTLIFTLTDGNTKKSSLVLVNAADMSEIRSIEMPVNIGFTTHGQFYHDM
jgi:carotenoid cleavage dioxygenase-like enzyme